MRKNHYGYGKRLGETHIDIRHWRSFNSILDGRIKLIIRHSDLFRKVILNIRMTNILENHGVRTSGQIRIRQETSRTVNRKKTRGDNRFPLFSFGYSINTSTKSPGLTKGSCIASDGKIIVRFRFATWLSRACKRSGGVIWGINVESIGFMGPLANSKDDKVSDAYISLEMGTVEAARTAKSDDRYADLRRRYIARMTPWFD